MRWHKGQILTHQFIDVRNLEQAQPTKSIKGHELKIRKCTKMLCPQKKLLFNSGVKLYRIDLNLEL